MNDWLSVVTMLAQEGQPNGQPQAPGAGNIWMMLIPFLLIFFLFQVMFNPQKREQKRVAELIKNLKKNDRVVTVGGIIGSVAQVSPEKNEITLKVDDNTRMRFRLSSIQDVLKSDTEAEAAKAS